MMGELHSKESSSPFPPPAATGAAALTGFEKTLGQFTIPRAMDVEQMQQMCALVRARRTQTWTDVTAAGADASAASGASGGVFSAGAGRFGEANTEGVTETDGRPRAFSHASTAPNICALGTAAFVGPCAGREHTPPELSEETLMDVGFADSANSFQTHITLYELT